MQSAAECRAKRESSWHDTHKRRSRQRPCAGSWRHKLPLHLYSLDVRNLTAPCSGTCRTNQEGICRRGKVVMTLDGLYVKTHGSADNPVEEVNLVEEAPSTGGDETDNEAGGRGGWEVAAGLWRGRWRGNLAGKCRGRGSGEAEGRERRGGEGDRRYQAGDGRL